MLRRWLAVSIGIFALAGWTGAAADLSAQLPPQPSAIRDARTVAQSGGGAIAGTIVSADRRSPIRRATVRLASMSGGASMSTRADDQGHFAFEHVPAGPYTLTASRPGFLDAVYGRRRPGSGAPAAPLIVAENSRVENLELAMSRTSVITGVVVDEAGEPAIGTQVRAMRFVLQNGERVATPAGAATTDDRGVYRIPLLPPGEYVVVAAAPNGNGVAETQALDQIRVLARTTPDGPIQIDPTPLVRFNDTSEDSGYPTLYYPGTTSAPAAQRLAIGISEERTGVDFQLTVVPFGRIAGMVTGLDPAGARTAQVQLADAGQIVPGLGLRTTMTAPDGSFAFGGLPPGQYTVTARTGGAGGPAQLVYYSANAGPLGNALFAAPPPMPASATPTATRLQWATADVSVAGQVTSGVTLALQPGMTVSGRLAFDGTGNKPADLTQVHVVLNAAHPTEAGAVGGRVVVGSVTADGQFRIPDLLPGEYLASVTGAGAWRPRSLDVGGRDALDFPLQVKPAEDVSGATLTLTDRTTSLSGTLLDASGQPAPDYTIIIASEDQRYWTPHSRRVQASQASSDGRFVFANLPAGEYRLLAVTDVDDGQWLDPAYLTSVIGASIPVSLRDGDRKVQDIRITR